MAESKITPSTDISGKLLQKIWHLNLLARGLLLKSDLDNEEIVEYVQRLISSTEELNGSLIQQLENITENLQDTFHLLSTLLDKHKELTASPEYHDVVDCLQKMKDYFTNTVSYLQEAKNKLRAACCQQDDASQIQTAQNAFVETGVCYSEREAKQSVQASSSPSQQYQRTPSPSKTESQNINLVQPCEIKTVKKEAVASLAENISVREQEVSREPPIMKEDGEHRVLTTSVSEKIDNNGKEKPQKDGSSLEKYTELTYQDDFIGSGESILLQTSTDTHDKIVRNLSEQEKELKLTETMKDNKKKTNYDMYRNDLITVTSSAQTSDLNVVIPSISDSEDVQKYRHWLNKEFVVEESGKSEHKVVCFIKAPATALENLVCTIVNETSSLVVDDFEELVSNVISVQCSDYKKTIPFPIIIAIPFISRFRGNYREIMVKVTDMNFHSNYLTPISLEGYHGNHKETFAEVKVYQLGVFSVLSCLKKETFTVPTAGLSQNLSMDSRISFYYPSETFTSPATMKLKIHPIEPSLISTLKARHDMYLSVVSTSALVYIHHPSAQPFNNSVTITLPCPPNPEKKRQEEETEQVRAVTATVKSVVATYYPRTKSSSLRKNGESLSDTFKLLGHRNKDEWTVFDNIIIQNAQNGLVSFELNEHLESFVVIRLSFLLENTYLLHFAQALEEAVCSAMSNVILYRKRENPCKIIVLLTASKELTWEIQNLHEEGYFGPPEPTQQFPLREGEQIHFQFRGNIFASENGKDFGKTFRLIFHSQRKPRLELHIKEVDEFGNHSSPHYKGTAVFYKITRGMITKEWKQPLPHGNYQHQSPLCKLPLTLPKREKLINRPQSTKRILCDSSEALWDNLLYWIAEELAEDNTSVNALHLPIRRSVLQLVRLKCPDNLIHQNYELLYCWQKTLPRSADKQQLLSRYLGKSGRKDLSEELHFKWQNKVFT
ncbi:death domain-containing protein 1 [Excalfactoria chinensis]|uniref:death domain-containing protein 1 n=1 Tax=Excalfactoria chinensis TaxID=46218 RepID=UPI003B3BCF3B